MGVFSKLKLIRNHQAADPQVGEGSGRILFVSHEATRTGAPKIILNVVKHFREKTDANLQTILHNGGHLTGEFNKYSEVDCLNIPRQSSDELTKKLRKLCSRYRNDPPVLAICNSMESRFVAYELHRHNIPILFLIHELPSSYDHADYRKVYECSEHVIFPVHTVHDAAHEKAPIPGDKGTVLPQGLLNVEFGKGIERNEARRQIREELSLPNNSHIILGCGTLDLRKGIDHFATVARKAMSNRVTPNPMHFVWLGEGPQWTHSAYHYVMLDVNKSPAKGHVHFVGERENVEPYFLGSDTFLLTSRVDPFPCVVHEAMASRLPVITFDKSGGAAEAVAEGAGIVVPYGDYQAMVDMINMLATQPAIAENIRRRSYEKVSSLYRFDHYANRLIRLAEETADRKFATSELEIRVGIQSLPSSSTSYDSWRRAA